MSRELNALLPTFFTSLLNFTSQTALLPASLTALHTLIPEHASTFRPNHGRSGPLMLSLIEGSYSSDVQLLAGKVYVDLHHSTQKGMNSDHWRSCLVGIISEVHFILDRMFEVVEEDRSKIVPSKGVGLKQLNGDYGVFTMNGIDRIKTLVVLISQFLRLFIRECD
jgi:rRNA processing/ribosome biogenesis